MTSTAGTDEHPEVAEISAFAEGILPPARSADLRGHLALCLLCADVRDSLTEIRALLGTLPGPPRMPEDVAGRIDAALAAEMLISATAPGPVPDGARAAASTASADGGAERPAPEPASGGRTGAAATDGTAAVEAGGLPTPRAGAEGAALPQAATPADVSREAEHVSRETSPATRRPAGRSDTATGPGRNGRRRRRSVLLTAASAVAVLGLGGVLVHALGQGGADTPSASDVHTAAAGAFSGVALPARVHQLLGQAGHSASPRAGSQAGQNSPFTVHKPAAPSCVLKATGRPDGPIAASKGTYEGHPSYLLVLPHPADASKVDAYVVDAACATAGAAVGRPGTVLVERTFPRG